VILYHIAGKIRIDIEANSLNTTEKWKDNEDAYRITTNRMEKGVALKMTKKWAVTVLSAILVLLSFTVVFAQEEGAYLTRSQVVEELVKVLYLSHEDNSFALEYYYCLHPRQNSASAHFVPDGIRSEYPILCEVFFAVGSGKFSDLTLENENLSIFIVLADALGIINGYDDGTLRPDRFVTFNEAITMLMRTFGFSESAEALGGYPYGYIKVAADAGITANIDFGGRDFVSAKNFNAMLTSALKAPEDMKTRFFMEMFTPPKTAKECVQTYAEAAMNRNGVLQYALYGDELKLRDDVRDGFVSFNWVTGVSSPWISGFEITQISDLEFQIVFHYATSKGPSGDSTVNLLLGFMNGSYRIVGLN